MASSLYAKTIRQMQSATTNVDRSFDDVTEGYMLALDGVKVGRFYASKGAADLAAARGRGGAGAVVVTATRDEAN
jgi:hypothetical protein